MAKIVKPVSLSKEAIDTVLEYKSQHNSKSFSQAVEDIILEVNNKKDDTEKIRNIVFQVLAEYKLSLTNETISATIDKKETDPVEEVLLKAMEKEFSNLFK